jgi:hypothetical protein
MAERTQNLAQVGMCILLLFYFYFTFIFYMYFTTTCLPMPLALASELTQNRRVSGGSVFVYKDSTGQQLGMFVSICCQR